MKIGDYTPLKSTTTAGKAQQLGVPSFSKNTDLGNLAPGRLVKGVVLSFSPDGKTVISVDGKPLTAQSMIPLVPGQEVWFEVLGSGEQPLLGLAGKKGAVVDIIKLLFSLQQTGVSSSGSKITPNIAELLFPASAKGTSELELFLKLFSGTIIGADSDPEKILKNSQALGLFAKLQPGALGKGGNGISKNQVMDFLTLLSQGHGSAKLGSEEESKGVSQLLKMFDSFAELNSQPPPVDKADFFIFPCFYAGDSGWGEWLFRFSQDDKWKDDSARAYGLSFFLEMSNLGELHLQLHLRDNALQGVFSVLNSDASTHVTESLAELSGILQGLGFQPVHLSCQVTNSSNLEKLKKELTALAGSDSFALVDVTI